MTQPHAAQPTEPADEAGLLPRAPRQWVASFVLSNVDAILDMFADDLLSFEQIAARIASEITEYRVTPSQLRFAFLSDARLSAAYTAAWVDRAHTLIEQTVGHANSAAGQGEHANAAAIKLKLAEKYAPKIYGAKVAEQGPGTPALPNGTRGVPDHVLEAMVAKHQARALS